MFDWREYCRPVAEDFSGTEKLLVTVIMGETTEVAWVNAWETGVTDTEGDK
jgi:hypothetical protein